MTQDPYRDYDDFAAGDGAAPGPQPVVGDANPFSGAGTPLGPEYGGSYTPQPNPFLARMPMPYGHGAPPPDRQRHLDAYRLNTWLSVFIPFMSIFFFVGEKGKSPHYDRHLRETMNMGLTRMLLMIGGSIFSGGLVGALFGLASVAYFVLAVLGALEAPKNFLEGREMRYKGAIPFTRD